MSARRGSFAAVGRAACAALACARPLAAQDPAAPELPPRPLPRTAAEISEFTRTSTSAEVEAFLAACIAASPRLVRSELATTHQGRSVPLVLASEPGLATPAAVRESGKVVVAVVANIHGGEVEGKEAVQQLLRELATGAHSDLLARLVIAWVPNLNPDGNDAFDRKNRPDQNGPIEGVGQRGNGRGRDLNRDFVKLEEPETRGLAAMVRAYDAAVVIDLHATDGSFHGYDLTYAVPMHPATPAPLLAFAREQMLPRLRTAMGEAGFAAYDFGDFVDPRDPAKGFRTFDCRPRFGTNYFGLCNRLTLLCEAYSHETFERRVRATSAMVLAALRFCARRAEEIVALRRALEEDAGALHNSQPLPVRGALALTRTDEVLVGECRSEPDPVTGLARVIDTGVTRPVAMPVSVHFEGSEPRLLPALGWALPGADGEVEALLRRHGIALERLTGPRKADGATFRVSERREQARPFQGRRLVEWEGVDEPFEGELPDGTLFVPMRQPLARLAHVLLDPRSDDGLGAWGITGTLPGDAARFGVVRIDLLRR